MNQHGAPGRRLTSADVNVMTFDTVRRDGYSPRQVDAVLRRVRQELELLHAEAVDLARNNQHLRRVNEDLRAKPPVKALMLAQQTAEALVQNARTQAHMVVTASRQQSEEIVTDSRSKAERIVQEALDDARREANR